MSECLPQCFRKSFWAGCFLLHTHIVAILIPARVELLGVIEHIEVPFLEGTGLTQWMEVFPAVVVAAETDPLRIIMTSPTM